MKIGYDIAMLDYINLEQIHYDDSQEKLQDNNLYSLLYDHNLYHQFDDTELYITEAMEKVLSPLERYVVYAYFYLGKTFQEISIDTHYKKSYLMLKFEQAIKKMRHFLSMK